MGEIFWGPGITQLFNAPGLPPNGDPRAPDTLVTPHVGVTYSGSSEKLAEHGGFPPDDTNVMMLLSNPGFRATAACRLWRGRPSAISERGLGVALFLYWAANREGDRLQRDWFYERSCWTLPASRSLLAATSGVISRCGAASISYPTINLRKFAERKRG